MSEILTQEEAIKRLNNRLDYAIAGAELYKLSLKTIIEELCKRIAELEKELEGGYHAP